MLIINVIICFQNVNLYCSAGLTSRNDAFLRCVSFPDFYKM